MTKLHNFKIYFENKLLFPTIMKPNIVLNIVLNYVISKEFSAILIN